jgi:hypothetical protein
MLASCYHVARGDTFKLHLELPNTFSDSIKTILDWNVLNNSNTNSLWYLDEIYATEKLNSKNVVYLKRNQMNRLDRDMSEWNYTQNDVDNIFIDCHCKRPYTIYKTEVDKLIESLLI